jgi:hypothetical protein
MAAEAIMMKLCKLCEEYKEDEIILDKISNYIECQLPNLLLKYKDREKKKKELENEVNEFTNNFLYSNSVEYYYIKKTDLFIKYNSKHFKIINNDDLLHNIFTDINTNKIIRKKKQQIKNNIIKHIKENDLTKSIPNSYTIQFIIDYLTPIFIKDRNTTKYFLTILGDSILKKKTDNIYYILPRCKDFLVYLKEHLQSYFKNSISLEGAFKYKYIEESHKSHRLVEFNENKQINNNWDIFFRNHILDIFTVAVHYSNRYKSAEDFLETHLHNCNSKSKIIYFRENSPQKIIKDFMKNYITKVEEINITKMELYYLWLYFIKENKIPNILDIDSFQKQISKMNYKYCEENQKYEGITSNYLSYIKIFRLFWNETIILDEESEDEFETSELFSLFNEWYNKDGNVEISFLDQITMVSVYKHFYNMKLEDNKIIKNITCSLWNKSESINEILDELKVGYEVLDECNISFQRLYKDYCESLMLNNKRRIVSKHYFLKYIGKVIPQQYIKNNYILCDYWN